MVCEKLKFIPNRENVIIITEEIVDQLKVNSG